ncbi:RluA family pseudouridine synthase [Emcibacter sp. SYSU 3D8]|uniref:RluA family pseudouridine synthase n=1 Tax=Emcibacter sp. SYSU 3D8 TaxID=3133969 RepID=UPI0031FF24E2
MSQLSDQTVEAIIGDGDGGDRLDKALAAALPGMSRARIQQLLAAGMVARVDGHQARTIDNASAKVKPGERYLLTVPPAVEAVPRGEDIPLNVVFEDAHLIVVDKPAGLVVHPAAGHAVGTLVNALIAHCGDSLSGIGGVRRPGIVHRLDKDTSGLMVAAKTDAAHNGLAAQFHAHSIERAYRAVCWGAPRPRHGTIETQIGRSTANRKKRAVLKSGGKHAVTHYAVEAVYGDPSAPVACMIECRLETGRTHQIRVHMAHIGHTVIGDPMYGGGRRAKGLPPAAQEFLKTFHRQALHAGVLGFEHPVTGKLLKFESELPSDIDALARALSG